MIALFFVGLLAATARAVERHDFEDETPVLHAALLACGHPGLSTQSCPDFGSRMTELSVSWECDTFGRINYLTILFNTNAKCLTGATLDLSKLQADKFLHLALGLGGGELASLILPSKITTVKSIGSYDGALSISGEAVIGEIVWPPALVEVHELSVYAVKTSAVAVDSLLIARKSISITICELTSNGISLNSLTTVGEENSPGFFEMSGITFTPTPDSSDGVGEQNECHASICVPDLRVVWVNMYIGDNEDLEHIVMPHLQKVSGAGVGLSVLDNVGLQEISFPELQIVEGSIRFEGSASNCQIKFIDLDRLVQVGKSVATSDCDYSFEIRDMKRRVYGESSDSESFFGDNGPWERAPIKISCSRLTNLYANMELRNSYINEFNCLGALEAMGTPLQTVSLLVEDVDDLVSLPLPPLAIYYFRIIVNNVSHLKSLVSQVEEIAAGAFLCPCNQPEIALTGRGIRLSSNKALEVVSFPKLAAITDGGSWRVYRNFALHQLEIPNLTRVDCVFDITNNLLHGRVPSLPIFNYDPVACIRVDNDDDPNNCEKRKRDESTVEPEFAFNPDSINEEFNCHVQLASDSNCFIDLDECLHERTDPDGTASGQNAGGCECFAKTYVCPPFKGARGPKGEMGAQGHQGAEGPAGDDAPKELDLLICSHTFTGQPATLNIDNGHCLFGNNPNFIAAPHRGVRARFGVSVSYQRTVPMTNAHHNHHEHTAKLDPFARCGPIVELLLNGHVAFKSSDVVFESVGTVSGSIEFDLPDANYVTELRITADRHCDGATLTISKQKSVEVTIIKSIKSSSLKTPRLLNE